MVRVPAALVASLCVAAAPPTPAMAGSGARADTPSGYPVPRFVSFRRDGTNCRTGPSLDHPVAATFTRAGVPVMVVAETPHDNWFKVRAVDGAECWAHKATLGARTHVILLRDADLKARPAGGAETRARLARGSLVRYDKTDDKTDGAYCRVVAGPVAGFVETRAVWGVEP